MAFVPLNRRFHRWTENSRFDAEALRLLRRGNSSLDWSDLLKAKRVVILAEGGSGKSTEFKAQHEQFTKQGEFSFLATVERVGKQDFDSALSHRDRGRLAEWRESGKPAWFFVDSVDEAKRAAVRFEDALDHIADSIRGAEGRAHVIVSGRHADWEFKRDLTALADILPIHELAQTPLSDPNELVIQALHRKKVEKPLVERPLIVLMEPLSEDQVERFATGKGVSNAPAFLAEIDNSRLWSFASRPVDLDWLVGFWINKRSFDNLERMLELSLFERLRETDRIRAGQMSLGGDLAINALERIGAALVLGKRNSILIPDTERTPGDDANAISLSDVLTDLAPQQQWDLLNSAVFVPAESGLVRIHSDNEGVVRSYLAARWIRRLRDSNCPWGPLSELLFATTYDVKVVKPSMRETAAWLAIWDSAVAQEILRRDPMLLVQSGDPASLPAHVRAKALSAVIQAWATRPHAGFIDHESLRRFARPDIEEAVKEQWLLWKDNEAIRQLLLMMIEAGNLSGCADIAFDTATNLTSDSLSQSLAARVLAAIGTPAGLNAYRVFLLANRSRIDHDTLWVAVDELFPAFLSVEDLITLMADLTRKESAHANGIDFYGPKLAGRINETGHALALLRHLISIAPQCLGDIPSFEFEQIEARINTMRALAIRILDLGSSLPPVEIFDLQLWLDHLALSHPFNNFAEFDLGARLSAAPRFRQAWLWRAAEKYSALPQAATEPLSGVWQFSEFAYYPNFGEADIAWLFSDLANRPALADKLLALDALLRIWNSGGKLEDLLRKISEAAKGTQELEEKIELWIRPVEQPQSVVELNERHQARHTEMERQREEIERSWTELADNIRKNPQQLATLIAPSDAGIDRRMHLLWNILRGRSKDVSHGGAPDLGAMRGVFDDEVIELFRAGLISHWRLAPMPILKNNLPAASRNMFSMSELMGLDGVSLEALSDPRWAEKLSGDEPTKAAIYATFALNKLPHWLPELCDAHPLVCADTLRQHLALDTEDKTTSGRRGTLERVAASDIPVVKLIERDMWELVEQNSALVVDLLSPALKILQRATVDRSALFHLVVERSDQATEPGLIAEYLDIAFSIDSHMAADRLVQRVRRLEDASSRALARILIPKIFGNSWSPPTQDQALSVADLECLILFAFDRIPPSDDPDRANGKVYSPDERDHARGGRDLAFNRLANTSGAAAYAALNRLIAKSDFPHAKWHLVELARKRAENDSESASWRSSDLLAFEDNFQALPRTPSDLQRLVGNRFADLQHDLIHSDFAQGSTVAKLENEMEVQRWFAHEFRTGQGRSFGIEREPHTADEKEPDLRIRAKASDASLPIEIKVAGSWSVHQLEEALTIQLMKRYLRDRNDRWGILLLVYQKERPQGWDSPAGGVWDFYDVVRHLEAIARDIATKDSVGPQMQVCVIDVSSAASKPAKTARPRKRKPTPKAS